MSARRWLGWCAVGVLACGVTVAVRQSTSDPMAAQPAGASTPSSTTSVAAAAGASSVSTAPPRADDASATRLAAPTTAVAPSLDLPPVRPPAAGHHAYDARIDGTASTATLDIRAISGGRTIESQTMDGKTRRRVLRWTADAVSIVSSGSCTYPTPPPELTLPLAKDVRWRSHGTCRSGSASLTFDERARVLRAARVNVNGKPVDVWVIQRRSTMTASGSAGKIVRQTARTDLFAPVLGLVVYESGSGAMPDATGVVRTSSWELALRS